MLWFDTFKFGVVASLGLQYPPIGLTSANMQITGQAYGNYQYTVTHSSTLAAPTYDGFHLFDYILTSDGTFWASNNSFNNATGVYSGSANKNAITGEWVQIISSTAITITSYRITGRNDNYSDAGLPASWVLLGSTNGGSTWTTLDTQTGLTASSWSKGVYNTYTIASPSAFNTYAIVVRSTIPYPTTPASFCNRNPILRLAFNCPRYRSV